MTHSREEMRAEIKKLEDFQCYATASMPRQCLDELERVEGERDRLQHAWEIDRAALRNYAALENPEGGE